MCSSDLRGRGDGRDKAVLFRVQVAADTIFEQFGIPLDAREWGPKFVGDVRQKLDLEAIEFPQALETGSQFVKHPLAFRDIPKVPDLA